MAMDTRPNEYALWSLRLTCGHLAYSVAEKKRATCPVCEERRDVAKATPPKEAK